MRSSSIRDFRVDQVGTPAAPPRAPESAPQQNVQNRQSLVTEWTSPPESLDSLWQSWSDEQSPAPVPSAPSGAAAAPTRSMDLSQKLGTEPRAPASAKPPAPSSPPPAREEGFANAAAPTQLPWAAQLAHDEKRLEKAGAVDLSNAFGRQEILKIRTREFAQQLQKTFREQIDLFNECRRSASHSIHVYRVAGAPDDFMLFRNGLKLLVSAQKAGKLQFAFNQFIGQLHAPSHQSVLEIDAAWGAFDQLIWTYRGERVQILDVVRYFLTEFSRQSFR